MNTVYFHMLLLVVKEIKKPYSQPIKKLIAGVDRKNGYLIGLTDYFEKMLSCIGKP